MPFLSLPTARVPISLSVAAYACAVLAVGLAAVEGTRRLGASILGELATPPAPAVRAARKTASRFADASPVPTVRREAAMTPLQERWSGQSRPGWRVIAGPQFGGSSRGPAWGQPRPWGFGDSDEDERPAIAGTYRTVCVRLCDGYYFPINFAVTRDRLQRDSGVCASRCGAQGRLFVHHNPGGSVETMEDLSGRPYRQLRTAFLYRTELVANCKCQPDPWEAAAQDRHRAYALAQEAQKGSKTAAKELQALQDKMRQAANAAASQPPPADVAGSANPAAPARTGDAELARREDGTYMGLGGSDNPKGRSETKPIPTAPRSDPDWVRRAFNPAGG
jgi:hypothetical protein